MVGRQSQVLLMQLLAWLELDPAVAAAADTFLPRLVYQASGQIVSADQAAMAAVVSLLYELLI